jgi:hypothetical protein
MIWLARRNYCDWWDPERTPPDVSPWISRKKDTVWTLRVQTCPIAWIIALQTEVMQVHKVAS